MQIEMKLDGGMQRKNTRLNNRMQEGAAGGCGDNNNKFYVHNNNWAEPGNNR